MEKIIRKIFIRKHHAMVSTEEIEVESGIGIKGDINASILSPCQLLLVGSHVLKDYNYSYGDLNENLCIDNFDSEKFVSGNILKIGQVYLRVMYKNEPCNVVAPKIIKERGILTTALTSGVIKKGDRVNVYAHSLKEAPQTRLERFNNFIGLVPFGKVVSYKEIIIAIGGKKAHFRILPLFVKVGLKSNLPVHRIVNSSGKLITDHIPYQQHLLESEGIMIFKNIVNLKNHLWQPEFNIYNSTNENSFSFD